MGRTSTDIAFAWDLLTPDGDMITEDISFTATLSGSYCAPEPDVGINSPWFEDIDFSNVFIEVTKPAANDPLCFTGDAHSVPLPDELKPAFTRWVEAAILDDGMQEHFQEWLSEGYADDIDDSDRRYDERRDRELEDV